MQAKMKLSTTSIDPSEPASTSGFQVPSAPGLRHLLCLLLLMASTLGMIAADCVIVVDTSGSMRESVSGKDKRMRIGVVQNALREYLPALPQPSRVCLIAFNSGIVSEREFTLNDPASLQAVLSWVDDLDGLTRSDGQTHLWTTLHRALEVATRYSGENSAQPVIVRALTDGHDNQRVTSLEKVLKQFPLVDGEHIRGNLVLLGDLEFKTKLTLPEGAFTTTKSTSWSDIFPPVVLWFPSHPQLGDEVRFVENTRSIYAAYEWFIDGRTVGRDKVLLWRFDEARTHQIMLKVKGLQGNPDSTTLFVNVQPKESFTVEVVTTTDGTISPGQKSRFWVRPSAPANRFAWFVNQRPLVGTEVFEHQFDSEGTFEVKSVAWSTAGVSATNARTVTVKESAVTARIKAPSQVTAGQSVQFASDIQGPYARIQWRFGDGSTAADKDPTHTFTLDGQAQKDVQVWLRVESPLGRSVEVGPHIVRVQARQQIKPPVAAFRLIEQNARSGDPLHFVDESQGYIETWEWRVGGVRVANDKNPVILLDESGSSLVTLVVRGPGGTNEVSKSVSVSLRHVPVRVKVAASNFSGKAPLSVQFTNLSSGDVRRWLWEFGDGGTSTNAHPQHTFANATNYSVAVTAYPSDEKQPPLRAQITIKAVKPWPKSAKVALLVGVVAGLAVVALGLLRRRQREKRRLAVFWWPEQAAVCKRADLNTPDSAESLKPDVALRIRRVGLTQNLLAEALDGACIVTSDGQETTSQSIGEGARLVVKTASGTVRAVVIAVKQKPRRPSPATVEISSTSPEAGHFPTHPAPNGDFNWGWEPTTTKPK